MGPVSSLKSASPKGLRFFAQKKILGGAFNQGPNSVNGHGTDMGLSDTLQQIGTQRDDQIDIGRAALVLGAMDRPHADLDDYAKHLDALARDTELFAQDRMRRAGVLHLSPERCGHVLSRIVCEEYGYTGDHLNYDDLSNANLLDVIDRRKGLPVALGIIYLHVARAQGWDVRGLNFPGHFLLKSGTGDDAVVIDPFNAGRILGENELARLFRQIRLPDGRIDDIETLTARGVLLRLQNNLKMRYLQSRSTDKAVEILERMRMIAPGAPEIMFELGRTYAKSGRLRAAAEVFRECLEAHPDSPVARDVETALGSLRRRLN